MTSTKTRKRRPKPKLLPLSSNSVRSIERVATALAMTVPEGAPAMGDFQARRRAQAILDVLRRMA